MKKFTKIMYYDIIVERVDDSDIIMLSYNDIDDLVINIIKFYNVGDYKKYSNTLQMSEIDKKIIEKFKKDFTIGDEFLEDNTYQCAVCEKDLLKVNFNHEFTFHFCKYCGRIYINQIEFNNYIQKCLKKLKKYYFLKQIKRFLHKFKLKG